MLQISFELPDKHKQRSIVCSQAKLTIQETTVRHGVSDMEG